MSFQLPASGFRLVAAVVLLVGLSDPASAQQIRAAISPDTITVGDVAQVGVRITAPREASVSLPDSLPISGELENAGRPDVQVTENADGSRTLTAVYPITAWRPGVDTLPAFEVRVDVGGRVVLDTVRLTLTVASVLPADTAGIEARPPRDVLGRNRVWWLWALAALLLALAIALLVWWIVRRRRRRPVVVVPEESPRERALRELDAIRAERLFDRPSPAPFYERVSGVLRTYLAAVDARWSRDRTTSELSAALLPAATPEMASRLRALLREADAVKFANARPDAATSQRHLGQVRTWVEGFPPPPRHAADGSPEAAA
ncbi:MAG TPA: DUF4381 family protein [Longimicrobiales bacterium]